jgi:hypothetical protein
MSPRSSRISELAGCDRAGTRLGDGVGVHRAVYPGFCPFERAKDKRRDPSKRRGTGANANGTPGEGRSSLHSKSGPLPFLLVYKASLADRTVARGADRCTNIYAARSRKPLSPRGRARRFRPPSPGRFPGVRSTTRGTTRDPRSGWGGKLGRPDRSTIRRRSFAELPDLARGSPTRSGSPLRRTTSGGRQSSLRQGSARTSHGSGNGGRWEARTLTKR